VQLRRDDGNVYEVKLSSSSIKLIISTAWSGFPSAATTTRGEM
jgi:hypothetical protein